MALLFGGCYGNLSKKRNVMGFLLGRKLWDFFPSYSNKNKEREK
jgi:hypothetical protein